jgi:hypothetical protein
LLWDYRGISPGPILWKLVLAVSAGKTMSFSGVSQVLTASWTVTWQEANGSWVGNGPIYDFSYNQVPLVIDHTGGGDTLTKRYLIQACNGFPYPINVYTVYIIVDILTEL